jgi:hypothetical protein
MRGGALTGRQDLQGQDKISFVLSWATNDWISSWVCFITFKLRHTCNIQLRQRALVLLTIFLMAEVFPDL